MSQTTEDLTVQNLNTNMSFFRRIPQLSDPISSYCTEYYIQIPHILYIFVV